jgi:hypothetical protein
VIDEFLCRRPGFRAGREITLADGQAWTFPAPQSEAVSTECGADAEYVGLVRIVWEAENIHERYLAELVLAIYLIELNYHLTPTELESLFTYAPGSPELAESQRAFDAMAQEHLIALRLRLGLPLLTLGPAAPRPSLYDRLLLWLRWLRPRRRWFLPSRKGEAIS